MPICCTSCSETKAEESFYIPAFKRFVAWCAECRRSANAQHCGTPASLEARMTPRALARPERFRPVGRLPAPPNVRVIKDPAIARDIAFVISQLRR